MGGFLYLHGNDCFAKYVFSNGIPLVCLRCFTFGTAIGENAIQHLLSMGVEALLPRLFRRWHQQRV